MKIRESLLSIVLLFAAVLALGTTVCAAGDSEEKNDTENTISNGVFIGDIDISGMTEGEAAASVDAYIAELSNRTLTFDMKGHEIQTTVGELGFSWTNREIIEEAAGLGKSGNIIKRYKDLRDMENEPCVLETETAVDTEAIKAMIEKKCSKYDVKKVDGTLKKSGSGFSFVAGTEGYSVNVEKSAEDLAAFVLESWDGQDAAFALTIDTVAPKGTEEELSKVKDLLGSFTTSYASSGSERSGNVANGVKLINGTVVYPGETFSTYEEVSPFTAANGYYLAGSYLNGMVVESLGGGICQVSTTLYNAVLRAELEIAERSNHSMIVSYVDPSADAAIAGTYKDFKFKNNGDVPVYIEGYTSGKKITFNIYGYETRSKNRTIAFKSETLSTTPPPADVVTADPSLAAGTSKVTQSAHTGYVAKLIKYVYENGVQVSATDVNKSTYKASPKYISIGTAGLDAAAAATVSAQIAAGDVAGAKATAASAAAAAQAAAQAAADQAAADQAAAQTIVPAGDTTTAADPGTQTAEPNTQPAQ